MLYLPAIVAVFFYFEKRLSLAVGIAVCGSGIGTFAFAPLTNALLSAYTWKGTVLIEAGILLSCILCGMTFRPVKTAAFELKLDFRLLVVFIMFAVSNLLASIGFVVPYIFLPNRGLRFGFTISESSLLISMVGISNTIGRVVFGFIGDLKFVNRLMLYSTVLVICGVCSVLSVLLWTFPLQMCYSFCFGFFIGMSQKY